MLTTIQRITSAVVLLLTVATAGRPAAQGKPDPIRIPFEVYTLPNGLTTVLSVD